jgi:hypothetical protein
VGAILEFLALALMVVVLVLAAGSLLFVVAFAARGAISRFLR